MALIDLARRELQVKIVYYGPARSGKTTNVVYLYKTMNKHTNIHSLHKHIFWDLNINNLDQQKNKTIIIERVFNRGDIDDFKIVMNLYGEKTIKQEIIKSGFLDKKTLNWASSFFNIPKTKFQCYKKIQSSQIHWNF